MNEKIHPGPSATISLSQGTRKYVLEDVFWVPLGHCGSKSSTPPVLLERHLEKPDTDVSSSAESE
jgi:hypothetical protein